jgi:DNA-binding GntR family transcriptional regulator
MQLRPATVPFAMADHAPTTRTDWAHKRLKAAILTGELPPGAKLLADELAERWSVSATPLREAFQRLGGTGLVELASQRGARVAPFSLDEAADLYELRLLLEPRAVKASLEASDDAHRSEILAAHGRLERALAGDPADPVEIAEAHLAFHTALVARCPSAWMRRLVALLAEHSQRYQLLGAQHHRRGSDPVKEHAALRDAAVRGQVERAVDVVTRHLEGTLRAVRATMEGGTTTTGPRPARQRRKA